MITGDLTATERSRIIIADDHQLFRNGLRLLLGAFPGFTVVG
jgi:DNA-binding NarL/FixJ family response regulator